MAKKKHNYKSGLLVAGLTTVGVAALAVPTVLPALYATIWSQTKDERNVSNINKLLTEATSSGTKFNTMSSVVKFLKDKSVDITELSTEKEDTQYVWDKSQNTVFVMNSDGTVATGPKDYQLPQNKSSIWKMVNPSSESNILLASATNAHVDTFDSQSKYSQYLRKDESFKGAALTFCSGIDTGDNTDLILTYDDTAIETPLESVTITTNGCNLTVNSTNCETIEHYGTLLDLNVTALGSENSISTSGTIVGDVIMGTDVKGSFVAEEAAVVNTIYVADPEVTISVKTDSVGTVVPTTQEAAEAIDDIVETEPGITEPEKERTEQPAPDPESTELSGLGTERSPYIVTSKADFLKIHQYSESKGYKHYIFESTNKEIDGSDWETNGYYGNLYGTFDGNGLVINNLSRPLFDVVGSDSSTNDQIMKISNVTLNCDIALPGATAGVVRSLDCNAIFENVDVHGYISGAAHVGGYVCYGPGNVHDESYTTLASNWKFINCHSDAIISGTGTNPYVGAFVAHRFSNDDSVYTFEDSIFTGVINGTSDFTEGDTQCYYSYFVTGPVEYCVKVRTHYSDSFLSTYKNPENVKYALPTQTFEETVEGTKYKCFYTGIDKTLSGEAPDYSSKKDKYVRSGYIAPYCRNKIALVTQSIAGAAVDTVEVEKQAGAEFAYGSLFIGPNGKIAEHVNLLKSFEYENMLEDTSGQTILFKSTNIKNYNVYVNDPSHTTPGIQGDDYVIYDTATYSQTSNPTKYILVIQYKKDNGGRYIPFYTTKFTW